MANLYYRNLPGIKSEKHADALEISTKKSIEPFFNYYMNYRRQEEKKIVKIGLELLDWHEFFEKYEFDKKELEFNSKKNSDLVRVPRELKELRKIRNFEFNNLGLYRIFLSDDKLDDNKIISDLKISPKVSYSKYIRNESVTLLQYVSKNFEVVVMRKRYDEKKKLKRKFSVYYKPHVRQINLTIDTLAKLRDTPGKHNRSLIRLFESKDKTRFEQNVMASIGEDEWLFLTDIERDGNYDQREFVRMAIETPDYAILDGPPGSGKTTTILELIYQLISRNQKVLLVGSTHVAVDNVIEKLMDPNFLHREAIDSLFLPIRIGDPNRHPISDFAADYTLNDLWNTKRIEQIRWLRNQIGKTPAQVEWEELLSNNSDSEGVKNSILKSNSLTCGTTIGITTHRLITESNRQNKNKPLFDYLILDEASKTTFQEFLIPGLYAEKFIISGDVKQLSPFVDENGLSSNIGDITLFTKEERYWKTVLNNYRTIQGKPKRALILCDNNELSIAFSILKRSKYFTTILDHKYNSQLIISDIILTTKEILMKKVRYLPSTIGFTLDARNSKSENIIERDGIFKNIETLPFLPRTYRERHQFTKDQNFIKGRSNSHQDDTWEDALSWRMIRLNEVSRIENDYRKKLEETISLLFPHDEKIRDSLEQEFADMYQITLPSIIQLLQEGLKVPMFRPRKDIQTSLSDGLPKDVLGDRYVKLEYQHRMHPEISNFARDQFYDNKALQDSNLLDRRIQGYNLYQNRLIWIDVINKNQSMDNVNPSEIQQIIYELNKLAVYLKNHSNQIWEIAVLTFYKAQRWKMYNIFDKNKNFKKIKSSTYRHVEADNMIIRLDVVDSFQGHEADFVYLSMVRNHGIGFMDNPNRLNVALTRAKYQLVIVGNKQHFRKQKRSNYLRELTKIKSERGIEH